MGAKVQSAGSVAIDAGRDIHLGTVTTREELDVRCSDSNTRQSATSQSVGTSISAQGNATLSAGRDIDAEAAKLQAGETLALDAQGNFTLQAAIDSQGASTYSKSGGGMNYFSLQASSSDQSLNRTTLSGQDVTIKSGGDTTLAAVAINAESLDIQTGGKLILPAVSTQDSQGWNVTHGSSASVGARGKGSSDEELNYNQFNIKGATSIKAQGGIQAQVGQDVDLSNLAQQPGMGWVSQITNDPTLTNSVEWQRVSQAHEQWAYHQSGMGPVSAALVAVMVSAAALPAAGAAGGTAGAAAGGTSTLAGTVAAGAVKAGVLALSSQVGQSFFNNNGDLGKVFQELGSSDSVKNLAAAVITGGVLAGMGFQVLPDQPNVGSGAKLFGDQLINNLQIQGTSTLINTAIKGGSFEDGLRDALLAALVNSMAATTANGIGGLTDEGALNSFTNKLAHAIAGCALGAANAGNSGGCAGGAIGAAVGEMFAQGVGVNRPEGWSQNDIVYMAGQFAGLAAALAGGDAEQIATANWAGSNAAANNQFGQVARLALTICTKAPALCGLTAGVAGMEAFVQQRALELQQENPGLSYSAAMNVASSEVIARAGVNSAIQAGQTIASWFTSTPAPQSSNPGYAAGGVPTGPNNTGNTNPTPDDGNGTTTTPNDGPGQGTSTSSPVPGQDQNPIEGGGYAGGGTPPIPPWMLAVPPGDRDALSSGLAGVMGGLPQVTGVKGVNQISEYPTGTQADAERIFDGLPLVPGSVEPIKSGFGDWGRTGRLPDGTSVTVRPSKDGRPTIQVVDRNRPGDDKTVQEIRFGSKS